MTSEAITFREAVPADIDELAFITERANARRDDSPTPAMASDETIESVQIRMERIRAHAFTAVVGEKIVGYALSHPLIETGGNIPQEDTDTEHLAMLMVDPEYWGKQVASRLLALTIEHAQSKGRRRLTLWTREANNSHAREIYKHKGFSITGAEKTNDEGRQVQYQLTL